MSITTSIRYGLARWLAKAAAVPTLPQWARSSFLIPTFDNLTRYGYEQNATVMLCISALTFAFAEPPLLVWSDEGEVGQKLPKHPLRRLLRNPNPLMGEDELMRYTIAYMAIGGNAFWLGTKTGRGVHTALWPYHAGQVRCIPGGPNWITGYEFFGQDGWEPIDQDAFTVVHFKWPNPDLNQPWQAQPALRSVASAVDTTNEIDNYVYSLLKNDAVPRMALKLPQGREMDKPAKDRFRSQWQAMYGGTNRGGIAILDQGADITRVGLDMAELAFDALRNVPQTEIAGALRVPPILAGLSVGLEHATYSNIEQASKDFTNRTLVPLWRGLAAEVESALGAGISVRHDLSAVASLQEDTNERWRRVNTAWLSGLIKKNEARRALGYADEQNGEVYLVDPKRLLLPDASLAMDVLTLPARQKEPA